MKIILSFLIEILIEGTSREAELTTTVVDDNGKETTSNEDGNLKQTTVPLATLSTVKTERKKDKISSSNVEGLYPFGKIGIFLFFQITSLKLASWVVQL